MLEAHLPQGSSSPLPGIELSQQFCSEHLPTDPSPRLTFYLRQSQEESKAGTCPAPTSQVAGIKGLFHQTQLKNAAAVLWVGLAGEAKLFWDLRLPLAVLFFPTGQVARPRNLFAFHCSLPVEITHPDPWSFPVPYS